MISFCFWHLTWTKIVCNDNTFYGNQYGFASLAIHKSARVFPKVLGFLLFADMVSIDVLLKFPIFRNPCSLSLAMLREKIVILQLSLAAYRTGYCFVGKRAQGGACQWVSYCLADSNTHLSVFFSIISWSTRAPFACLSRIRMQRNDLLASNAAEQVRNFILILFRLTLVEISISVWPTSVRKERIERG